MEKLDLSKKHKSYYTAKAKPSILEVERACFISICGKGDPSGEDFAKRIEALYTTAYTIKFMLKGEKKDFTVAKLEGLWWFDEEKYKLVSMEEAPLQIPRSEWNYRLMIRVPEFVDKQKMEMGIQSAIVKKGNMLIQQIEWFEMEEGESVQVLHVGPFDKEPESLLVMQSFMNEQQLERNGLHHEIYLSDFRKTTPDKLKTILREPVK